MPTSIETALNEIAAFQGFLVQLLGADNANIAIAMLAYALFYALSWCGQQGTHLLIRLGWTVARTTVRAGWWLTAGAVRRLAARWAPGVLCAAILEELETSLEVVISGLWVRTPKLAVCDGGESAGQMYHEGERCDTHLPVRDRKRVMAQVQALRQKDEAERAAALARVQACEAAERKRQSAEMAAFLAESIRAVPSRPRGDEKAAELPDPTFADELRDESTVPELSPAQKDELEKIRNWLNEKENPIEVLEDVDEQPEEKPVAPPLAIPTEEQCLHGFGVPILRKKDRGKPVEWGKIPLPNDTAKRA